ncbi:MAG: DNA repair protein RecO [Sphingobacteriales bacterium]|nr:MAG: DNA repair protein RecO [Sphingobacteriales bacterium]
MLQTTRGILLRSIKYGETSLICSFFTEVYGVQSYIAQGVRTAKARQQRAGLLQPASLLELTVYYKPQQNLQRLREFQPAYIYTSLQEEVVKNSVALFSVELLLRLLPEHAPIPELFELVYEYFTQLDKAPVEEVGNYPMYFMMLCSHILGYKIIGNYSEDTPYLDLAAGAFSSHPPPLHATLSTEDARLMDSFLSVNSTGDLKNISLSSSTRNRLLDWYLEFMHRHTQHMGTIRSLEVLRTILH